jgi:hypothetical protein
MVTRRMCGSGIERMQCSTWGSSTVIVIKGGTCRENLKDCKGYILWEAQMDTFDQRQKLLSHGFCEPQAHLCHANILLSSVRPDMNPKKGHCITSTLDAQMCQLLKAITLHRRISALWLHPTLSSSPLYKLPSSSSINLNDTR